MKDPMIPYQVLAVMSEIGFVLQNNIIWTKHVSVDDETSFGHFKPVNSPRFLNNIHEHVFHLTKTGKVAIDRLSVGVKYKDQSNATRWEHGRTKRCAGNVWFIPYDTITNKADRHNHPAAFPKELVRRCLKLSGVDRSGIILDPFAGSGTTNVVASEMGFPSIGFELSETYYETIKGIISSGSVP